MGALIFLGGMGAGAFVATVLLAATIRLMSRDNKTAHERMHAESLEELRRRNDLLEDQNAIFARLEAAPDPSDFTATK